MVKFVTRVAVAAFLAGVSTQAIAGSEGWSVSESSGNVVLQRGGESVPAKRGAEVRPGDAIVTGAGGRAVLVHGQDFVTVASNTRIRIPAEQKDSLFTRFIQEVGNAIFRVEKRGTPHFSVDTPYLAAVVKGTTFSITVGPADTALQVTEGVVEVSTTDGGARELVRPGSVAMIAAGDRYRLSISGDHPQVVDSPLRQQGTVTTPPPAGTQESAAPSVSNEQTPAANPQVADGAANEDQGGADTQNAALDGGTQSEGSGAGESLTYIDAVISSKPVDMGKTTDGMVSGPSPVVLAAATTSPAIAPKPDRSRPGESGTSGKAPDGSGSPTGDGSGGAADTPPAAGDGGGDSPPVADGNGDHVPPVDSDTGGSPSDHGSDTAGNPSGNDGDVGGDPSGADGDAAGTPPGSNDASNEPPTGGSPASDHAPGPDDKPATDGGKGKDDGGKGKDDKPAKGDDGKGKDDKPAKDDDGKGKDDKPAKDDDGKGKDDKPAKGDDGKGKDDKPAKGDDGKGKDDKPAKGDDGKGKDDKPAKGDDGKGKDDKPAKGDDGKGKDKPAKGEGGKDKPAKGDDGKGKDDKPAKDDDGKGKDDKPAKTRRRQGQG